jgi:hypothetical protein
MKSEETITHPDSAGVHTHAVCACCAEHFTLPPDGPVPKHLNNLAFPVLLIDLHAKTYMIIKAVNARACDWLSKERLEIVQYLCGNVIGCAHACLREGCGGVARCATCTVKQAVATTLATGEPQVKVPFTLHGDETRCPGAAVFSITTIKTGQLVMLRMDTITQVR